MLGASFDMVAMTTKSGCVQITITFIDWRRLKTMSVEQMRAILKRQYKGAYKWVNRVNKMSDAQVVAVYHRMLYAHQLK